MYLQACTFVDIWDSCGDVTSGWSSGSYHVDPVHLNEDGYCRVVSSAAVAVRKKKSQCHTTIGTYFVLIQYQSFCEYFALAKCHDQIKQEVLGCQSSGSSQTLCGNGVEDDSNECLYAANSKTRCGLQINFLIIALISIWNYV